jgi:hypothetical protein
MQPSYRKMHFSFFFPHLVDTFYNHLRRYFTLLPSLEGSPPNKKYPLRRGLNKEDTFCPFLHPVKVLRFLSTLDTLTGCIKTPKKGQITQTTKIGQIDPSWSD